MDALLDVRPLETIKGEANRIYQRRMAELLDKLQVLAGTNLGLAKSLWQVASGNMLGLRGLLAGAAREFAALRGPAELPTVLVVGEIYVRSNAFANDSVVERLEARGMRVKLASCGEFIEYIDHVNRHDHGRNGLNARIGTAAQERIRSVVHRVMTRELGGHARTPIAATMAAAKDYVPESLECEAILTVGAALHHWRAGEIDAVVNIGPLECMPTKVAEAQFFHIAQREGLPSLTLSLNGDSINTETLDNFAFEVHERFRNS